ncbi:hypothetical protein SUGI_1109610 [Cryptomeria japonica]|nr:hypothetical protein SUGI_1109610 [Cryptomeria japonica]
MVIHNSQIANHNFTVVNVDAAYTKPYNTDVMMITPGQTADILVIANSPPGEYFMAARSYTSLGSANFNNSTTTAILRYEDSMLSSSSPILPPLPPYNDTPTATKFSGSLRSLATPKYPIDVPQQIDDNVVTTMGLGLLACTLNQTCAGPNGFRFAASMNNISFVKPSIAILQAYYFNIEGVFTSDFPSRPPFEFNYTGENITSSLWVPVPATKAKVLKFNSTVQLVLQGTSILLAENHPMHLHGYSFYIVGQGFGNYDAQIDPLNFNIIDPPLRNTVGVPINGWVALRFKADNPGAWYLHCHYDDHLPWGLSMVFIVQDGLDDKATLKPPPPDLPRC